MANSVDIENLSDSTTLQKGNGTATASPSGVLHVSTTQAATGANTTETDLWTYSLPANTLSANGKSIRVSATGRYAANGNGKTVRGYFHTTALTQGSLTLSNVAWLCDMVITRLTSSTAMFRAVQTADSTGRAAISATIVTSLDFTGAITIKVTGQNGSANANDILSYGGIIEALD